MVEMMLSQLRALAGLDKSDLPAPKFMGVFRRELIKRGFEVEVAEALATQMDLNIPPGSMTEEQIIEAGTLYADLVASMTETIKAQGFENYRAAVVGMARNLSFRFD